jgi:hypothetical protein
MSTVGWRSAEECVSKKHDTRTHVCLLPRQLQVSFLLHQRGTNIKTQDIAYRFQTEKIDEYEQ